MLVGAATKKMDWRGAMVERENNSGNIKKFWRRMMIPAAQM